MPAETVGRAVQVEGRGWLLELPPQAVEDCGPQPLPGHHNATSSRPSHQGVDACPGPLLEEGMPGGRIPLVDITVSQCNTDGGGSRSLRERGVSVEGKGKNSEGGGCAHGCRTR